MNSLSLEENSEKREPAGIKPPPPPPSPLSPASKGQNSQPTWVPNFNLEGTSKYEAQEDPVRESKEPASLQKLSPQDTPDDDFGDFQTAG